jgi:DNA-directed RNA polymerase specialized sigma24 family protein
MSKKENKSAKGSPDERDWASILSRMCRLLEILVRLNLEVMRGSRPQSEMILVLDSVGCGQSEIASLLGTTRNTVNVTLYNAKKKNRNK